MSEKSLELWCEEHYADRDNKSRRSALTHITHGASVRYPELYRVWQSMKSRCNNPRRKSYQRYGGRGIEVCDEWSNNAGAFAEWAIENGYEKGLQLDRIDNDKGYSPDNCRWVTPSENCRNKQNNKRITLCGINKTIAEWGETLEGFNMRAVYAWMQKYGAEGCERRIYRKLAGEYEYDGPFIGTEEIAPYTNWPEFMDHIAESGRDAVSINCDTREKAGDIANTIRRWVDSRTYSAEVIKKDRTVYVLILDPMMKYHCNGKE